METPRESDAGYPEEQPEEVADGGDTPQENREREGEGSGDATESGGREGDRLT